MKTVIVLYKDRCFGMGQCVSARARAVANGLRRFRTVLYVVEHFRSITRVLLRKRKVLRTITADARFWRHRAYRSARDHSFRGGKRRRFQPLVVDKINRYMTVEPLQAQDGLFDKRSPMKTRYDITVLTLLIIAIVTLAGCVRPGDLDPSVLGRYQREMGTRAPAQRSSEQLAPYLPGEATKPPLKKALDEQSGLTRIFLSLEDAVMRGLANSLDIRVVSYDPSISYEEMVKAAAEFDYVVFGGFSYENMNENVRVVPTAFQEEVADKSSSRSWQVGLRQKTITGATWAVSWDLIRSYKDPAIAQGTSFHKSWDNRVSFEITQPLLRDAGPEFNLARLRVARLDYRISMAAFRDDVQRNITEIISLYWRLIQSRRDRVIQRELLDRTIETYERTKKRKLVDATDVEVKQAEAAVESRRAILIRSLKTIYDVQQELSRRIGDKQLNALSDYEIVPTSPMSTDPVQINEADQLLTALRFSPILEQVRLAIDRSNITVKIAENQTLPRLDLTSTITTQGVGRHVNDASSDMASFDYVSQTIAIEFEYPIGNRERTADLRRAKQDRMKAITQYQNTADVLAVQIRDQIREIQTSFDEYEAQRRAVAASQAELEALEATEELRRLTPEFMQVKLSAQLRLAIAERAELAAMVNYNIAQVSLARITGTVPEMHQVQIALPYVLGEGDWPITPTGEINATATKP